MIKTAFPALLLALSACHTMPLDPAPPVVDHSKNGGAVAVAVGETLTLRLESNGTAGYSWVVTQVPSNLRLAGQESEAPPQTDPPIAGAPGAQVFRFTASRSGRGTLRLAYRQAGSERRAAETFRLTVVTR